MEMTQAELEYISTLLQAVKILNEHFTEADLILEVSISDSNNDVVGTVGVCEWGDYVFRPRPSDYESKSYASE